MKNQLLIIGLCLVLASCSNNSVEDNNVVESTTPKADSVTQVTTDTMGTEITHEIEFAEKKQFVNVSNLPNFESFEKQTIVCGFLQYLNDNGQTFNYKAINAGSAECILYDSNGSVTYTSGRIDLRKNDTYSVTIRPGGAHGWVCY